MREKNSSQEVQVVISQRLLFIWKRRESAKRAYIKAVK